MVRELSFSAIHDRIEGAALHCGNETVSFNHLSLDSRKLKRGDIFVACKGFSLDGRDFVAQAIDAGVNAVVCEAEGVKEETLSLCSQADVTCVLIPHLNEQLSELAGELYGHPSKQLTVIGVTGTNGKSSSVQMMAQALHLLEGCCWTLGTLGCGPFGAQKASDNTTADAITVQKELARAVQYGCPNAAMEVSSHGLVQGRVNAIDFSIGVFTNLTRDHLDYHGTMEAYGEAKRQLFLRDELQWAVINVDDKYGRKLKKDEAIKAKKLFVSLKEPSSGADLSDWIWVEDIRLNLAGIKATLLTPWGSGKLKVPLIGRFNLHNLLAVVAVLGIKLQNIEKVLEVVAQLTSVLGRMQVITADDKPLVIVDYAHTPDALEQALKATREHCSGRIITVFGCGGDRDPGKRPLMARVAEKYSNKVIMTDDNPRTEQASTIIDDMRAGFKQSDSVKYIADRAEAIQQAITIASNDDVILVAGKGHEDYQIHGKEKRHFSDIETARELLGVKR